MQFHRKTASASAPFEKAGVATSPPCRVAELVRACDRLTAAADELRRQALADDLDASLLPLDVAERLRDHLFDDPRLTAAAVVSRAITFYFRNLLNCEAVPPDLARMLLAGRAVEPVPPPAEAA